MQLLLSRYFFFFFFQAEDGIRDLTVTGVQTCALPISSSGARQIATCTTRSLPARLASYIAASALRRTSSESVLPPVQDTTPMLAVTDGVPRNTVRMLLASRAAAALATVPSVSGISTANS